MTDNEYSPRDTVVVGGGAAGLAAALTLARARRRVTVVDAGRPRNAPAAGVHGLLGMDGVNPTEFLARGREEVRRFGGEILAGEVVGARRAPHGVEVSLEDGVVLPARTLLIATGVVDELPAIPGVREQWGRGVLHCPYCHGWEVRDRRIGVLATHPMSAHQAVLFHQWSRDIVFFSGTGVVEDRDRTDLNALGIPVVEGAIARVESDADGVTGVRLDSGEVVGVDAVVVASRLAAPLGPFGGLGIEASEHPNGTFIETDEFGATSVAGVWAAGNTADLMAQVGAAAAQGTRAAQAINASLVAADLEAAVEAHAAGAGTGAVR